MEKYISLLNPNKIKEDFVDELVSVLAHTTEAQVKFRRRFESNLIDIVKHPTINLTEVQIALVTKVEHMMGKGAGLRDVVIMLDSFSRGTKRLRSNICELDHERQYTWHNKDGNDKLRHAGNLSREHFRWNFGKRYTLPTKDIDTINKFIQPLLKHL